jgi:hypothetical protein
LLTKDFAMSQTHPLNMNGREEDIPPSNLPLHGGSPSPAQSTLWQYLLESDIVYLLNALPDLESPLSSPLSRLITCLRAHSEALNLPETVTAHQPLTSCLVNTPSDPGAGQSASHLDLEQAVTHKRKEMALQLESDEEETGQSRKKRKGKKKIATHNSRGDLSLRIIFPERLHSNHHPDSASVNQSHVQQLPFTNSHPITQTCSTKKPKHNRGEEPKWTTNGPPPPLTDAVMTLAIRLCSIQQDIEHDSFMEFLHGLVLPTPSLLEDLQSISGAACLKRCHVAEQSSAIHDFYHMVALVQAAFWIER